MDTNTLNTKLKVLVCGGAGYIGSHAVNRLEESGYRVIIVDNLSTGHKDSLNISANSKLYQGDMRDQDWLNRVFDSEPNIHAVMHFAADSLVGESMKDPLKYYDNNVGGAVSLLKVMNKHDCKRIVFSSTAATYGDAQYSPIDEKHPTIPKSPYGNSKLMMEQVFKDWAEAYGGKFISLRYFNVAGAHVTGDIGEDHKCETHLIPLVLKVALGQRESIAIFGTDWNTRDGTCIRDYIHMEDLMDAHMLALSKLDKSNFSSDIFNLGTETGATVREVIEVCREVTNHPIPAIESERRAGDPETLVASYSKALEHLGWQPTKTLKDIVESAWNYHQKNPTGYKD